MGSKEHWRKARVAVIGGGSWGTVLANLAAQNCAEVRVWLRDEESVRMMNTTRANPRYTAGMRLNDKILALNEFERVFENGVDAVIWALPAKASRERAREASKYFSGREILIHATKGVESESLKRISVVLEEEIPCPRIGVVSGPNLAAEIAEGKPAATVVASVFAEVVLAGQTIFASPNFRVYGGSDVVGVEWAGILKNVLAIAAGCFEGMELGENARAMLISRGLLEMLRFGVAMGANASTFFGLAGIGDVMATCTSPLSRNFRVGQGLAKGQTLEQILEELGSTAEGVNTARTISRFAQERGIPMPIFEAVQRLVDGKTTAQEALKDLMSRPQGEDIPPYCTMNR